MSDKKNVASMPADFSKMTDEEKFAWFSEQLAKKDAELEKLKTDREDTGKTIKSLNKKLNQYKSNVSSLKNSNQELKAEVHNQAIKIENYRIAQRNIILEVSRIKETGVKILNEDQLPSEYSGKKLQDFCLSLIASYVNTYLAKLEYCRMAFHYDRTESNRIKSNQVSKKNKTHEDSSDLSVAATAQNADSLSNIKDEFDDDDIAKAQGLEDLKNSVKITFKDCELEDFEENSKEFKELLKPGTTAKEKKLRSIKSNSGSELDAIKNKLVCSQTENIEGLLKASLKAISPEDNSACNHDPQDSSVDLYRNEGVVKRKRKAEAYISATERGQIAGIIRLPDGYKLRMRCDVCKQVHTFKVNRKIERINDVVTKVNGIGEHGHVMAPVVTATCEECGHTVELSPAELDCFELLPNQDFLNLKNLNFNVPVTKSNNSQITDTKQAKTSLNQAVETSKVEEQTTLKQGNNCKGQCNFAQNKEQHHQNFKLRQIQRKAEYKKITSQNEDHINSHTCNLHQLLTMIDGYNVIDPSRFDYGCYANLPCFVKSRLSNGLLASNGSLFAQMCDPKNRIINFNQGLGLEFTREHMTGAINCFARAFLHGVQKQILRDMKNTSTSILMDESVMLVRQTAEKKEAEGKSRLSQIWAVHTGWTNPNQAAYYCITDNRSYKTVVELLNDLSSDSKIKYLTSDGYAGYPKAISILKEKGISIEGTACSTHLRRAIHRILRDRGLLSIYNEYLLPKGSKFSDFSDNLKLYMKQPKGKALTQQEHDLLIIYYLINTLFVIDSEIVVKHDYNCTDDSFITDLQEARRTRTSVIIDALYDAVRLYIVNNPDIMEINIGKDNVISYKSKKSCPESKALIYILKQETAVRNILKSAEIELCQSSCERALKLGICARKNCYFLDSEDGAHAFADYMTVAQTCALNRVPMTQYLLWLIANVKVRLIDMKAKGSVDPTYMRMPKREKSISILKDKKTGKNVTNTSVIGMYHADNHVCYDNVDYSGLTPYDYRHFLDLTLSTKR